MSLADVIILSNGPGEITTWVYPVVEALRSELNYERESLRISVVLSPCPHATGQEGAIAASYAEVDRVLESKDFYSFLLWGKTPGNWHWHPQGVVIFLGGDQFFPLVIASRLRYFSLIYAEWDARWQRWVDHFAVRLPEIVEKASPKYRHKFTVVGDLMAVEKKNQQPIETNAPLIGLLPGSKAAKLAMGLPLCLGVAAEIDNIMEAEFILPLAPTLTVEELASFADAVKNPVLPIISGVGATILREQGEVYLKTQTNQKIKIIRDFPANEVLSQCSICFTTVGANTAQLTALGVPMIVMLPTQQLEAMRAWDGLPGILANLPGVGVFFAKLINYLVLKQNKLFAWPNIWAKEEVVPELVGKLQPKEVAEKGLMLLNNPEKLQQVRDRLLEIRPQPGAAKKIAEIVNQMLSFKAKEI